MKAQKFKPTQDWSRPPKKGVTAPRLPFDGHPAKAPKPPKIKIPPQVRPDKITSWRALMPGAWEENQKARNDLASRMGFKDFASYTKSPLFWKIRKAVLARDAQTCYVCGDRASLCHFASYSLKAMEGSDLASIFSVCFRCTRTKVTAEEKRTQSSGGSACPGTMKNGGPCTLNADRDRNGTRYCHLHDPCGKYMLNSRSCGSGGLRQPVKTVEPRPH